MRVRAESDAALKPPHADIGKDARRTPPEHAFVLMARGIVRTPVDNYRRQRAINVKRFPVVRSNFTLVCHIRNSGSTFPSKKVRGGDWGRRGRNGVVLFDAAMVTRSPQWSCPSELDQVSPCSQIENMFFSRSHPQRRPANPKRMTLTGLCLCLLVNSSAPLGADQEGQSPPDLANEAQFGPLLRQIELETGYRIDFPGPISLPRSVDQHRWAKIEDAVDELAQMAGLTNYLVMIDRKELTARIIALHQPENRLREQETPDLSGPSFQNPDATELPENWTDELSKIKASYEEHSANHPWDQSVMSEQPGDTPLTHEDIEAEKQLYKEQVNSGLTSENLSPGTQESTGLRAEDVELARSRYQNWVESGGVSENLAPPTGPGDALLTEDAAESKIQYLESAHNSGNIDYHVDDGQAGLTSSDVEEVKKRYFRERQR